MEMPILMDMGLTKKFQRLIAVYLICLGIWVLGATSAIAAPIQVTELRELIQTAEDQANQGQIDQMIANFREDAQITIYSLESDPLVMDRASYYRNLASVFRAYRHYRNRMVIDRIKIIDPDHALIQGTTYEQINDRDRPINGISNWQAQVSRTNGKLQFTQVDAHLARAQLTN
ncbi:MAG: hypothetical protein SFT94_09000 [Pseudanabaenaceae cyanobacterium bins.68]|nr:hypothetical protein [Pseudanabaenaceae cyanobacterium bins.68]